MAGAGSDCATGDCAVRVPHLGRIWTRRRNWICLTMHVDEREAHIPMPHIEEVAADLLRNSRRDHVALSTRHPHNSNSS